MSAKLAAIGAYVPDSSVSATERAKALEFDTATLDSKIGTVELPVMPSGLDTSDMAVAAVEDLLTRGLAAEDIDGLILCTQNPDGHGLPHTSAVVHGKLGLPRNCMCFDISLGCSGFVHGLAVARGLMESYGLRNVVLVTADPYSKVMDTNDAHTSLIFGDGACAAWVTSAESDGWKIGPIRYMTDGKGGEHLMVRPDGQLYMNGREVFFFAAKAVPAQAQELIEDEGITTDDIDLYVFHQGSKYILETITKKLGVPAEKVPSNIARYGNLVSSSIPMLLKERLFDDAPARVLISGFGVGLSAATMLLEREAG